MSTGYTADVQNGKVTDFKVFALRCARAFGALVEMRDDPFDAPIKENKVSPYYEEHLNKSKQEYNTVLDWSSEEASLAQYNEIKQKEEAEKEINDKKFLTKQRYNTMLLQVKNWYPPTPDHDELKKFMIDQLEESIKFDCAFYENEIEILSPEEYKCKKLQEIQENITYYKQQKKEEEERVTSRNKWINDLKISLENT